MERKEAGEMVLFSVGRALNAQVCKTLGPQKPRETVSLSYTKPSPATLGGD